MKVLKGDILYPVSMQTLAEHGGMKFTMESYDEETGAAAYSFEC